MNEVGSGGVHSGCTVCGAPSRQLLFCEGKLPGFQRLMLGNKVLLAACSACGALWCFSRQGLRSVPICGVRWWQDQGAWTALYDRDDGATLCEWHFEAMRRILAENPAIVAPWAEWRAWLESRGVI